MKSWHLCTAWEIKFYLLFINLLIMAPKQVKISPRSVVEIGVSQQADPCMTVSWVSVTLKQLWTVDQRLQSSTKTWILRENACKLCIINLTCSCGIWHCIRSHLSNPCSKLQVFLFLLTKNLEGKINHWKLSLLKKTTNLIVISLACVFKI